MAAVRFAVVVDGEVAITIVIDDESPIEAAHRAIAAYRSPHQVIEYFDENVKEGWFFDGTTFSAPTE